MSSPEDGDGDIESRPISEESLTSRLAIRSRPQSSSHSQSISSPGFPKSLTSSSNDSKPRLPRFRAVKSATDSYKVSDTRERSASSDFRSVIDDLTVKNQKLKKKLQKLQSKKDHEKSLFELKIHDLSPEKSAELVAMLRSFVDTIPEGTQQQGKLRERPSSSDKGDNGGGDSAYASLTPGDSSTDASSQMGKTNKPKIDVVQMRQSDAIPGIKHPLPAMSKDLIKMKMVVLRLEQVFIGRQGRSESGIYSAKEDVEDTKKASQNVEYLHHLTSNRITTKSDKSDSDENEWIYLNLLNNEAKLHEFNVTPLFIRRAVSTMSRNLELSSDGQRVRWRGREGSPLDDDDCFPPISEQNSPENSEPAKDEPSTKPKRKTMSSTFAPARYSSPKDDDLPTSLRYDPVFLPKDASSSSSNIDSMGTSSLSSSEGEDRDGQGAGPISFFKGRFFLDLTSTHPDDVISVHKDEPFQILGSPVKNDLARRRANWRRLSPTPVYFSDNDTSENGFTPLEPFVITSDYSIPDSRIRFDDDHFDSTGLTRLEDHFSVTLHIRAAPPSQRPSSKRSPLQSGCVQPHIAAVLKEIEADRESLRSESESEYENKILDVTFAKLAPTKPPPTFYHQNSTSSDELSISS